MVFLLHTAVGRAQSPTVPQGARMTSQFSETLYSGDRPLSFQERKGEPVRHMYVAFSLTFQFISDTCHFSSEDSGWSEPLSYTQLQRYKGRRLAPGMFGEGHCLFRGT